MKASVDLRRWVRMTWLLITFIVLGIGVGCIWWPQSRVISEQHSRALELYDEANSIDAATRRASQLRAAQLRITSDLSELGGIRSPGAITVAVLQLLHEESKRQGVEIREVAPDTSVHGTPSRVADGDFAKRKSDAFAPSDVSISVRGPFRNIVSLVADLPRHDVLIDVRDIQLSSTESVHKPPFLDVTLHTTIYRLESLPSAESFRVRTVR